MSVVHVVAAGEIGGAERMLVDLMRDPKGPPASIALLTPSEALRRLFVDSGLTVDDRGPIREHPVAFLRPSDVAWLTDVLEKRRAKVVHLHTFASQVLGTRAALRAGARIVRTEHSTRVYDDASCRPFARWSLARADRIVFISEHVRRTAFARMPALRSAASRVVHNGVDVARFAFEPLPSGPTRFVALGRLDPRKGLELAIAAVSRVPCVTLEIVGDGADRARLTKLAGALGDRVTFHGHTDDVRPAIARAHAVLTSAREEGLGIALLEAMAMGRPVVGVPVGGIPEIVADGTGWLATSRTVEALADVIAAAAADAPELAQRGARARTRVENEFSVDAMRAKYVQVYEEMGT